MATIDLIFFDAGAGTELRRPPLSQSLRRIFHPSSRA